MSALPITAGQFAAAQAMRLEAIKVFEEGTSGGGVIPAITTPGTYDDGVNLVARNFHDGLAVSIVRAMPSAPAADPWHAATLLNSWVNAGGGYRNASYRLVGSNVVMAGVISTGTVGTICCTLPVGYRPTKTVLCASTSFSVSAMMRIKIDTDGSVTVYEGNSLVALDGVSFFID